MMNLEKELKMTKVVYVLLAFALAADAAVIAYCLVNHEVIHASRIISTTGLLLTTLALNTKNRKKYEDELAAEGK